MPTAKPDPAEVEVLPPDSKFPPKWKFDGTKPDSKFPSDLKFDESEPVIRYHLAAERCGNLSIWCAAMAGAEILKRKNEFGHGKGFTEWRDKLPFGHTTTAKYTELAKALEERINSLPKADLLALLPALKETQRDLENRMSLLSLPSPMDVFNPAHEQIASIIRHIANGQTLTQLYFDWNIVKQPKLLGGHHPGANPLPVGLERERLHAEAYWSDKNLAELYHKGVEKKLWKHLSIEKMRMIHDVCGTIHAELGHVLKDKKA